MARTAAIILDGVSYVVPAFNIGQLEIVSEIFDGPIKTKIPYKILRLALDRADPKPNGGLEQIEPTFDEINKAFEVIAELSGIPVRKASDPQEPVAPAAT